MIEVLVATILMAVIGSIVVTTLVASMRVQRQQTAHLETMSELRTAFERVTRDVRGSDPILLANPTQITTRVCEAGGYVTKTYTLLPDGTLQAPGGSPLIGNLGYLAGTSPFTYLHTDGSVLTPGADPTLIRQVRFVTVKLRTYVTETGSWIDMQNRIAIRNSGANTCA